MYLEQKGFQILMQAAADSVSIGFGNLFDLYLL